MANMLMFETNKYAIKIDNFEGPLDLLCHLIDKNKMDIYDIKINEIADQYIEYLNQMEEMNLDIASEFLIMASTLIYLKSKSLLPKQDEVEEELTEEELIQRIIEYKKYKEIIKKLRVNYEENSKSFFKMPEQIELPKKQIEKDYDKDLIPNLYKTLWNKNKEKINKNAENIQKIAITESYTVTSKVKEMFKALIKNNKFVFNKLFSIEEHNKQEVVTAFSGLLEMSKRDKVNTKQEDLFEDIIVEKKKKIV
ncbi:MAG: segregation/condensation protein A [Clostridium sp.]|jgi:segregation and condensation protein A|nr:segregation/condensation protein A [Clostridium sp.]MEE0127441.1 segregation/condensation protein A [Clostridia bacterium]